MFQFPRFPLPALCVQAGVPIHDDWRVSPFGYLRINAWSTAPRSFSQPPTSFIGSRRQGIHRWHFIAWNIKDARARYRDFKDRLQPGSDCRRGVQNGPTNSHIGADAGTERSSRVAAPSKRNRGPTDQPRAMRDNASIMG